MIFIHRESRESQGFPADHRSESRLSIPRRGALQQSSSPLPQPSSSVIRAAAPVQKYSANGECLTFRLFHFWGAPQSVGLCPVDLCDERVRSHRVPALPPRVGELREARKREGQYRLRARQHERSDLWICNSTLSTSGVLQGLYRK
jgi:hypothetical protein